MKIGDRVIYVDEHRKERNALVQCVHDSSNEHPSLNLVVLSDDPKREDSYGRQTEHVTSVVHTSKQGAGGFCWK